MATQAPPASSVLAEAEQRVVDIVRGLAEEIGGSRAARAVAPGASLEREVGLGSLERVELLVRLEAAFGRSLNDQALAADSPAELARMLLEAGGGAPLPPLPLGVPQPGAPAALSERPDTVHRALWLRGRSEPDRPHVFLRDDDGREDVVTYGRLLGESARVAGGLRERGVGRGEAVALMLPTGLDFLRAFQGILMAGAVPVPIYPPVRLDRLEEYAQRQAAILADAGATLLVTVPRAMGVARTLRDAVPSLRGVVTADELAAPGATLAGPEGRSSEAAFIQYTSGSTGHPKGVLLTHANLLANIEGIARGLDVRPTDVGASWLPLYHDMGLIGSWLFCLVRGLPLALQSPLAFLARPERWLRTIHERRATLSAAPNFAYELCVRKIPDAALEGLDLSSWRCALNGAEPVNPDTLERFAKRFSPYGFQREALMPVYGLAENSVGLLFPPVARGPRIDRVSRKRFEAQGRAEPAPEGDETALRFVSVGSALPEHEVRIVDDAGSDVADRTLGRLVFRGPSMTSGYYGNADATAAVRLPGGFLDSGDLAYAADGEVFIAGRKKDLIIKAGRNLVPQEIEEVASGAVGIRRGCVVAFGVPSSTLGTERLVVVAETRETDPEARTRLEGSLIERIASVVGVPPDQVALVAPGVVPKTSSGKVRRGATRELFLSGALGSPPRTSLAFRLGLLLGVLRDEARPRMLALVRGAYAVYLALLIALTAVIVWPLALVLPGRRALPALARACMRFVLWAGGCSLSAEGLDRVRGREPAILVCNHASYLDVPVLLALLPVDALFVAKKEILSWPLVGTFVRRAGHLTVDREDSSRSVEAATDVARRVEGGRAVLLFPEATFTSATGLRTFRLGAFKTAVDTGVPVVPLVLRGTRRVLREGTWIPRPGRVHLWVGQEIPPTGNDWRAAVALRDRARQTIAAECGEPCLDIVDAGVPRG